MTRLLQALIRGYRRVLSPLIGPGSCRYHPTCSAYALEALAQHGALRGGLLAIRRILSCHPYSRRPFHDPVPEAIKRGQQKNEQKNGQDPTVNPKDQD
jgi:putative membrane protein insertion efficiency factor